MQIGRIPTGEQRMPNSITGRRSVDRLARYRGLRGFVRHVISYVRGQVCAGTPLRSVADSGSVCDRIWAKQSPLGVCKWCGEDTGSTEEWETVRWHVSCEVYYQAALGMRITPTGQWIVPQDVCPCGGSASELEYKVVPAVAAKLSEHAFFRSLLPENLVWLCCDCHRDEGRIGRRDRCGIERGKAAAVMQGQLAL